MLCTWQIHISAHNCKYRLHGNTIQLVFLEGNENW